MEQHCLDAVWDTETGDFIWEEADCDTYYADMHLQSVGEKKNFRLRLAIYDDDMAGGFVQYSGQTGRIPIYFHRSETVTESHDGHPARAVESHDGETKIRKLFYNEMYKDEINGMYVMSVQGERFSDVSYVRKRDGKVFHLTISSEQ